MTEPKIIETKNTGYGSNADAMGGRLTNKDGSPNVIRTGLKFLEGNSWFHTLLIIKRWKFILVLFIAFLCCNFLFTLLYYLVGVHHLTGITPLSKLDEISKVFFFSVQTFTTVGYGHISPNAFDASAISSLEAFCGLLFFALATGLLYGRFARAKAHIRFSHNALIAPYQGDTGLMFRLVPYKNNKLADAEVRLTLALVEVVDGKRKTEFYTLDTEISKVNSLVLSWTVVHPIVPESPLYGLAADEYALAHAELIVFFKAFDETACSTVIARTSYTYAEMVHNAKFTPMFQRSTKQATTTIDIDKLNHYEVL